MERLEKEDYSLKSKILKDLKINQFTKQNLNTMGKLELDNISVNSSYLDDKELNESEI
jgi:hypothetical protein